MRKILKVVLLILVMVGILGLASLAQASFWIRGMSFHYSPNYGDLKGGLDKAAPNYNVQEQLSAGTGLALSVGYDFSKNWGIRLDSFKFTGIADYHHLRLPDIFYFETSTSPLLISVIYRIQTPANHLYLGAGIGKFPSELTITANIHKGAYHTDSSIGYQILAGAEFQFKGGLFFFGEFRYLSAKAEFPGYRCIESCSTDWSGIFASIGVGYTFK